MRNLCTLLIVCFFTLFAFGQEVIEKRYKTGELASRETIINMNNPYNPSQREEKVEVFNKKGELVYHGHRRNYAGHSSIYLTYHENGGVKTIKYSSAPDGGIQWYRSNYVLDEDGGIISKMEDNYDTKPTILIEPSPKFPPRPEIKQVKENECATPMETQTFFTNKSKKKIEFLFIKKDHSVQSTIHTLKPNKTIELGKYINAETFREPLSLYEIQVKKGKSSSFETVSFQNIPVVIEESRQHKVYRYYWIE